MKREKLDYSITKVVACVLISLMVMSAANAAYSFGFYKNSNHPGKCYINESMILSLGDVRYFKPCTKLQCNSENGDASIVSCGVYAPPPGCTYYYPKADENYPKCCEIANRCPNENEVDHDNKQIHAKNDIEKYSVILHDGKTEKDTTTKQTETTENNVDSTTKVSETTENNIDSTTTTAPSSDVNSKNKES